MTQKVFGITGWKNSGKTTLTERLVAEFTRRGLRVATVKHAHHSFDVDHPGTDSFRHRNAGAVETAIVSSCRWALLHEMQDEEEPALDDILAKLSPCDLVLVEGYKKERHPKLECRRIEARDQTSLAPSVPNIVATAGDVSPDKSNLPHFSLEDAEAIADFIARHLHLSEN